MCAGNLISSCGDSSNFPQEALERFTSFGLECLKQADAKYELKETAINYFSEISKVLRSQMAPIIPMILDQILESTETKVASQEVDTEKKADEFDLDSDEEDEEEGIMLQLDYEAIDEQVSAIHCLGNLSLNCSGLMQPHLERICEKLKSLGGFVHENVRYHVSLSLTQIAFGLLRLALGKQDSDDKFRWEPGFPPKEALPDTVKQFLDQFLIPHLKDQLAKEVSKSVVEKLLENIRDLADEMGPSGIFDHIEWIVGTIEQLLDKTAPC